MKYDIEKSQKPKYLQIYKQIKADIITNAYPFNAKLPSKRILSEELSVSVITIEHAYQLLIQEGYIESKAKSGYYVIYKQDDFFSQQTFEEDLSSNSLESSLPKAIQISPRVFCIVFKVFKILSGES